MDKLKKEEIMKLNMEIIKKNKVIAKFMGWKQNGPGVMTIEKNGKLENKVEVKLVYHSNWSALMPVVEKIVGDSESNLLICSPGYLSGSDRWLFNMLEDQINGVDAVGETLIKAAHKAVYEFIKKHNEGKFKLIKK